MKIPTKIKPKIVLVDYGVASNHGDHIEINRDLLWFPDLYDYVLEHELGHAPGDHCWQDIKNDITFKPIMVFRLILFSLTRPKTWIEFLPVQKREGKIIYDPGMFLFYGIALILILALAGMFLFF